MVIHESAEDYLESILVLQQRRGQVRSIDIVNELGYSKPSVSIAMKKLRENGYISMDPDGIITLNESGMEIASRVYGRHKTLSKLFVLMGVTPEVASEDACKVEHDLSEETFRCIQSYLEKMMENAERGLTASVLFLFEQRRRSSKQQQHTFSRKQHDHCTRGRQPNPGGERTSPAAGTGAAAHTGTAARPDRTGWRETGRCGPRS